MQSIERTYDISKYGFLPEKCETSLPANFSFMSNIVNYCLAENQIKGDMFRRVVEKGMPEYSDIVYDISQLTLEEKKYLYSIFSMICQRYIWCNGVKDAVNTLPKKIGYPWHLLSRDLGITPSLTHASVDLFNWKLIDSTKEFSLENIDTINSMTGRRDESWFYLIMIAIEGEVENLLIEFPNTPTFTIDQMTEFLKKWHSVLVKQTQIIKRMYENCDPAFFFNELRIYLSGSNNDNIVGKSVSVEGTDIQFAYVGGSAAQSSLIQAYDIMFDVHHTGSEKEFLDGQLQYMPGKHREYLAYLKTIPSIKTTIKNYNCKEINDRLDIEDLFDKCIDQLIAFNRVHASIINKYIMKFVMPHPVTIIIKSVINSFLPSNKNAHGVKGSGGTNPVIFVNNVIKNRRRTKFDQCDTVDHEKRDNTISFVQYGTYFGFCLLFVLIVFWLWQN